MGAKFTGKGIMPDEHVQPQLSFSYDAKRDRWNGYNLDEHATIIEEHTKVEMAKRKLKAEKLQEELLSGKLPEGSVKVYIPVLQWYVFPWENVHSIIFSRIGSDIICIFQD